MDVFLLDMRQDIIFKNKMTTVALAKKLTRLFLLVYLCHMSLANPPDDKWKIRAVIRQSLLKHFIIPDVLSAVPGDFAVVMYSTFAVNMGNKMDPRYAQHTPSVSWPAEDGCLYTLMMVDADVPTRRNTKHRCRQHWLVVNIPRVDIYNGKTITEYIGPIAPRNSDADVPSRRQAMDRCRQHWLVVNIPKVDIYDGKTLTEYLGPRTPRNSGLHRVIFLVFKQKGPIETDEPFISVINRGPNIRTRFIPRNFSAKYSLSDPVAVNFFQVGYPIYRNKEDRHSWHRKGITPPPHFLNVTNKKVPRPSRAPGGIFGATEYTILAEDHTNSDS